MYNTQKPLYACWVVTKEDEVEDNDCDVEMLLGGEEWCGDTIELELKHIATQQTLKEMICFTGNLIARSLTMGSLVRNVHLYGINSSGATFLKLCINFPRSEICLVCSVDRVAMYCMMV